MPEEYKTTDLNPVFAWFYRSQLGAIILVGVRLCKRHEFDR